MSRLRLPSHPCLRSLLRHNCLGKGYQPKPLAPTEPLIILDITTENLGSELFRVSLFSLSRWIGFLAIDLVYVASEVRQVWDGRGFLWKISQNTEDSCNVPSPDKQWSCYITLLQPIQYRTTSALHCWLADLFCFKVATSISLSTVTTLEAGCSMVKKKWQ